MHQVTDWPDRLYVEESNHSRYQELLSKGDKDSYPFKVMKEIFMFSLVLGYLSKGNPKPLDRRKELIHERFLDSKTDKPLIQAIYMLSHNCDRESILDKAAASKLAEEYANLGFDDLYEIVMKGEDMVISLTKFLVDNHISIGIEDAG
jgi:hypothetical protein